MFTAESADSVPSVGIGSPTVTVDHPDGEVAVGLADPSKTGSRKAMLQLINRLRDTGYGTLSLKLARNVHDMCSAAYKLTLTFP